VNSHPKVYKLKRGDKARGWNNHEGTTMCRNEDCASQGRFMNRDVQAAKVFEGMGGYAPTIGIIGAVMGAGIAAGGWGVVNWGTIGAIVISWVLSPMLGAAIAMAFLYVIKRTITYQTDMTRAASKVVPVLLALMGWAFVTFMLLKGVGQLV
jgi:hypothetical protein